MAVGLSSDPAWQVREGAAKALGSAEPGLAVPVLLAATGDGNIDVRRAAVCSLARWAHRDDVVAALRAADGDPDATSVPRPGRAWPDAPNRSETPARTAGRPRHDSGGSP